MAMKRLFNLVMLILMVSVIQNERMVKVVEGKFCWSPSRLLHGRCVRSKNCAIICEQEGFATGVCKGMVNRRCMCGRDCEGGDTPPGGDFPPPEGGDTPPPLSKTTSTRGQPL